MKLYSIMLFIFIFSLTTNLVTEMGIMPTGSTINVDADGMNTKAKELKNEMVDISGDTDTGIAGSLQLASMAFTAIGVLVGTFTFFIYGFHDILTACGVPEAIALLLQTVLFLVMSIGIAQLVTNRGFKNYE